MSFNDRRQQLHERQLRGAVRQASWGRPLTAKALAAAARAILKAAPAFAPTPGKLTVAASKLQAPAKVGARVARLLPEPTVHTEKPRAPGARAPGKFAIHSTNPFQQKQ